MKTRNISAHLTIPWQELEITVAVVKDSNQSWKTLYLLPFLVKTNSYISVRSTVLLAGVDIVVTELE